MKVRVYEGFDRRGPGGNETPLAIDTQIGLTTCPDGNLRVDDLDIGGLRHDAGEGCAEARGNVRFEDGTPREPAAATAGEPKDPPVPPRCDPATWRCTDPQAH